MRRQQHTKVIQQTTTITKNTRQHTWWKLLLRGCKEELVNSCDVILYHSYAKIGKPRFVFKKILGKITLTRVHTTTRGRGKGSREANTPSFWISETSFDAGPPGIPYNLRLSTVWRRSVLPVISSTLSTPTCFPSRNLAAHSITSSVVHFLTSVTEMNRLFSCLYYFPMYFLEISCTFSVTQNKHST